MKIRKRIFAGLGAAALAMMMSFPALASGWQQNGSGYWYEREDKSYPAGTWELIQGKWYLVDQKGYMLTGWRQVNGIWYYLDPNGAMVSNTTLTIDGVPYTFDSNGAMVENTLGEVTLGRWEGSVFINDWSNIRLTLPQGFINFDSDFMTDFSDSEAVVDMLSMKNKNCAVMVFYTVNTDGDDMDQMTAFLNMFYGGSTDMDGLGRIDTVKVGDLEYLRCFFSASQEDPQTGYLYIRNLGSHYSVIATISDTDNLPVIDSVLSTLTTAH